MPSLSKARPGLSCSCYCLALLFLRFRKSTKRWNPTPTSTLRCSPLCCTKRKQRFLVRKTRSPFLWSWFGFLSEVNMGQQDIQKALSKSHRCRTRRTSRGSLRRWVLMCACCMLFRPQGAYERSLRKFHPWLQQATFNVSISLPSDYFFYLEVTTTWLCFFVFFNHISLKAAPSYQSFTAALVSRDGDKLKGGFTDSLHRDLGMYLLAIEKHVSILEALCKENNMV